MPKHFYNYGRIDKPVATALIWALVSGLTNSRFLSHTQKRQVCEFMVNLMTDEKDLIFVRMELASHEEELNIFVDCLERFRPPKPTDEQ